MSKPHTEVVHWKLQVMRQKTDQAFSSNVISVVSASHTHFLV